MEEAPIKLKEKIEKVVTKANMYSIKKSRKKGVTKKCTLCQTELTEIKGKTICPLLKITLMSSLTLPPPIPPPIRSKSNTSK